MPNIKDVAQLAGVSVATVSRFINSKGYVSEASKLKITEAITALNYRPNLVARSLSTKQDNTIALLVPDITNPFFPELARAIEDVCIDEGYSIILCNTDNDLQKERNYLQMLMQKYVAGIITTTSQLSPDEYESLNIPIVGLDRVTNANIPCITTDNYLGGQLAAQLLVETGSRHILLLAGPQHVENVAQRVAGFTNYLQQFSDISVNAIPSYFNYKKTYPIILEQLQQNSKIDAIFSCSDLDAVAAVQVANKLEISVPEDLQIIGFDGTLIGEITTPTLTTVAQNIYSLGEFAAKQLISQLSGNTILDGTMKVSPELIVRESTRKCKT